MPTCSRGTVEKTISGTIKLKLLGVEITSFTLTNERASDTWDNCSCAKELVYRENRCITADANDRGQAVRGSASPADGITIEYDLTVDTTRRITNCDYDCVTREAF